MWCREKLLANAQATVMTVLDEDFPEGTDVSVCFAPEAHLPPTSVPAAWPTDVVDYWPASPSTSFQCFRGAAEESWYVEHGHEMMRHNFWLIGLPLYPLGGMLDDANMSKVSSNSSSNQ